MLLVLSLVFLEGGGTYKKWGLLGDFRSLAVCLQRGLWDARFFMSMYLSINLLNEVNELLPP
jgi:hypothetical protein